MVDVYRLVAPPFYVAEIVKQCTSYGWEVNTISITLGCLIIKVRNMNIEHTQMYMKNIWNDYGIVSSLIRSHK